MENYTSLVDDNSDEGRSSAESSEGFSFSTTMDLRKNLTASFDKQVSKYSLPSTMSMSSNLSVNDRIAQFEAAATTTAAKPPRPVRQQSNVIPTNRVSVYLRIRPPVASKKDKDSSPNLNTIEVLKPKHPTIHPTAVRTYPPSESNASKINLRRENHDSCVKEFEFHQVLDQETTQQTVYSMVATPMLQSLFDATKSTKPSTSPQSALLFSYGITNAGKTHTILGDVKSNTDAKWGVIPRAISDIFDRMKQMPKTGEHYDLYMSYFEIYNEQIYDLVPKKSASKNVGPPPALKVREGKGQTIVRGLAKHKVRDVSHGIDLTAVANNRRHTSSNNLNAGSSRSHCVCQMQIVPCSSYAAQAVSKQSDDDSSIASMSGYSTDEEAAFLSKKKISTIWIVDLAGSERSKRTGMGSARQKEASQINKSLMTLMRCLTVMRESGRQSSSSIVPFRESKLTHVFMSHLTGPCASRTSMIVNVNPAVADFDETQHVLAYASKAKMIKMDAEQLTSKRKQYSGDEYGMDGRKKGKTNSATEATKRLVARVAKKLSPKKAIKMFSPKKMFRGKTDKRKLPAKTSSNVSKKDGNEPAHKRMKPSLVNSTAVAILPSEPAYKLISETSTAITDPNGKEKEFSSLKMALNAAQAEVEMLKSEKAYLTEELGQQESQIRIEVSQEMEERLRVTRERNNEELERLRSQINANPMPCRSTRKAQMDKAENHIEELMDKVDECEEEMVRMRQDHSGEKAQMQEEHTEDIARLKSQLEELKNKPSAFASNSTSKRSSDLEKELEASRTQVQRLEKSKIELIENYEKLLKEADEEEEEDDDEEEEDTENQVHLWKQRTMRSKNHQPKKTKNTESRKALGIISTNSPVKPSGKGEQWIFPKKPSSQDAAGDYKRPFGRAPYGREWDASVGAWKLNAAA
jgi:hypothetical protein